MKTTLYYFTGTGNSLAVARRTAEILGETDLVSIPSMMQSDGDIIAPAGRVGIVCPVYDSGIPIIVGDFLRRLRIGGAPYVFGIITLGGTGGSALKMMNAALMEKNGKGLDAGFIVKMPGNFPPVSSPPTGNKLNAIFSTAEQEIQRIGEIIKNERPQRIGMYPLSSLLKLVMYGGFAKGVHSSDEKFSVSESCNSCGICVSVCPTGNITLEDGKPVYHHRCELCCACLNFCPVQAIDLSFLRGTKGRGRYHHPDVKVADMKEQKVKMG